MSASFPTPPRSTSRDISDGPPLSDAARLYLARSRSHTSQHRDVPEAKRSRAAVASSSSSSSMQQQRPPLSRSASTSRRCAPVRSASAHDWVAAADLPLTPAQQSCPYPEADASRLGTAFTAASQRQRQGYVAPPEPSFAAHGEHYATPESSPEGADELSRGAPHGEGLARAQMLSGRSAFVKRDDLTAKAVARAASMSSSAGSASSLARQQQQQPGGDKDRFVSGLVGEPLSPVCRRFERARFAVTVLPRRSLAPPRTFQARPSSPSSPSGAPRRRLLPRPRPRRLR